jgi:hypothetical protein
MTTASVTQLETRRRLQAEHRLAEAGAARPAAARARRRRRLLTAVRGAAAA